MERRNFLKTLAVFSALSAGGVACNLSISADSQPASNTNATIHPIPTDTLGPTNTATPTETATEVLDPLSEILQGFTYNSATKLYEKDGRQFKLLLTSHITKGCPEQLNISLIEIIADCVPSKNTKQVNQVQPSQVPNTPGQPNQPQVTSVQPQNTEVFHPTRVPNTTVPPQVTQARTQPPQPTRTPGGSGATPIVNTPLPTAKPPEIIQPTVPPASAPSSTPSF